LTRPGTGLGDLRHEIARFDRSVDALFDRLRGRPLVDRVLYTASDLGDLSLLWLVLAAARGLRSDRDLRAALRLAASAGVESVLVNGAIKSLFRRDRPFDDLERPHYLRQPRTSSFPSGHATSAFSALVVLGEDDVLAPLYGVLAAVVAVSRIHVKIHHASDVVAGALLGLTFGAAVRRLFPLGPR